jgi:hypothetical protein
LRAFALAVAALLAASPTLAQAPGAPGAVTAPASGTVTLRGLDGQSVTLTAAQVAALPHQSVTLIHEGKTTVYSGPLLSDMLRDLDAPMGVKMHGQAVNDVLFVTAADKYRVVLTLAEVDPSVHKGARVILADQADGKTLDAHEGPFRLVVDGDLKPARSARSVVEIDLKHLP